MYEELLDQIRFCTGNNGGCQLCNYRTLADGCERKMLVKAADAIDEFNKRSLINKRKTINCTGKNCIMQYGTVNPATCKSVSVCPYATLPKTNADHIRAMKDEELANMFCELIIDRNIGVPAETWLEWLKHEYSGCICANDENSCNDWNR